MILTLSNGYQIRGDLIKRAVVRSDMAPIPVSLEAEIRIDDGMKKLLAEGQLIMLGVDQTPFYIVSSAINSGRVAQGSREVAYMQITAFLDAVHEVGFVRRTAIIKEKTTLSAIYRAAGARIRDIEADFPVTRFCCPVGETPTYHIARVLQEEGGIVRWKNGKLHFIRLPDLFKQRATADVPANDADNVDSGFLERHTVPWFYSLSAAGAAVFGNREKARAVRYSPFKTAQQLRNMSRCLIQRKVLKTDLAMLLNAGDAVNVLGTGDKLAIVTAAHVFEAGTEGETPAQYSRLWLASMEE